MINLQHFQNNEFCPSKSLHLASIVCAILPCVQLVGLKRCKNVKTSGALISDETKTSMELVIFNFGKWLTSHENQHSSRRSSVFWLHESCCYPTEFVSLSPPPPTSPPLLPRDVEKHSFEMNHVICTRTIEKWILVCDGGGMLGKWHGIRRDLKKRGTLQGYDHPTKELWPDELRASIHDCWDLSNKSSMEICLIASSTLSRYLSARQ